MRIGFDFSGTVADDSPAIYKASRTVVDKLGSKMPTWHQWKAAGCANIPEFVSKFGVPSAPHEFSRLLKDAYISSSILYERIADILRQLRCEGHMLFLVSCCWQDILLKECNALGLAVYFDEIIGGLDSKRETLVKLALDFYVGDTLGDFKACHQVTTFIPVSYGYGTEEQFSSVGFGPHEIARNTEELGRILFKAAKQRTVL